MESTTVTPNGYGFAPVHAAIRRYGDSNILPGVSSAVLVGRDLVDLNCVGWADKERDVAMRSDHLFRVFSNTKLITTCAALLLLEEGRFQLDDPIEQFIPQLGNRRVLRSGAATLDDTEAAHGSITIRHLLSHSSGLSYGLLDPGTTIFKAYNERKVLNPATTLADMMDTLTDLPLVFHPGTGWEYSVATDTGFFVTEEKRPRLVAYYAGADLMDPMKPGLTRSDDSPYPGAYLSAVPRLSGGGGLISSLPDMLALLRSLLPGGFNAAQARNNFADDDQSTTGWRVHPVPPVRRD